MTAETDLRALFRSPPREYGPIPFYWWAGDPLVRERIIWQLDQLQQQGVHQTLISYPHDPQARTSRGEPELFTPAWWDLLRWFLQECRRRGMTTGIQDYTLIEPTLQKIGRSCEGMAGGQMSCVSAKVAPRGIAVLHAETGARVIGAWAYSICSDTIHPERAVCLLDHVEGESLLWNSNVDDEQLVVLIFVRPAAFDPMHPMSGALAIEALYEPFVRECPGEVGNTFRVFFQDELSFGARMPFWSAHLDSAFQRRKGYCIGPWLAALWLDLGPLTVKARLDINDVIVAELEACYFEPVFRWHERHGTLFGHDNSGRGNMAEGRSFYGDYFRTMKWFSAPGTDDPKLHAPRAFKGLKVCSSIAHLYDRARVWNEAFHSSGWGTLPAQVLRAFAEDFAYGATVVNLHGLYYSTHGGWWEWAPPDFHFRQPYWAHCGQMNDALARLSWLLSQGVHRCDVAILYPSASLEAEPFHPSLETLVSHTAHSSDFEENNICGSAERAAFAIGKYIFDHGCDFDFVDFASIERAALRDARLEISRAVYRVVVVPSMKAIRAATLEKLACFTRAGGLVVFYGCLPIFTDSRDLSRAPILTGDMLREPGRGRPAQFIRRGLPSVLAAIEPMAALSWVDRVPGLQVLHHQIAECHLVYVVNSGSAKCNSRVHVPCNGWIEEWHPYTGRTEELRPLRRGGLFVLPFSLVAGESRVFMIGKGLRTLPRTERGFSCFETVRTLEGPWVFEVVPTLHNLYGDYRQPPSPDTLGPEVRQLRYAEEKVENDAAQWHEPDFDDCNWPVTTYSFGPRFSVVGPLAKDVDTSEAGEAKPYAFSLRWGIERDPFLTDWSSGPHGLKKKLPDEYLDFGDAEPGSRWRASATVHVVTAGEYPFTMGARCAYRAWIDGRLILEQKEALPPGRYPPWNIPHYDSVARTTRTHLDAGAHRLEIELTQPAGQRCRAYAAFEYAEERQEEGASLRGSDLALRWFRGAHTLRPSYPSDGARRALWFRCEAPPGANGARVVSRGAARTWIDGQEVAMEPVDDGSANGEYQYHLQFMPSVEGVATLALRVEAPADSMAGDALPEPIKFTCGRSLIDLGDWCERGLASYSGHGVYRKQFVLSAAEALSSVTIDLGDLAATAEIKINGSYAATLVSAPWRCDITDHVRAGENELAITIANTLANHYSVGIPTPYFFPEQCRSGLFGPVRLIIHSRA